MNENLTNWISIIADKVYENELKDMTAEEFFELDDDELEDKILKHLNYTDYIDNVKAVIIFNFNLLL